MSYDLLAKISALVAVLGAALVLYANFVGKGKPALLGVCLLTSGILLVLTFKIADACEWDAANKKAAGHKPACEAWR